MKEVKIPAFAWRCEWKDRISSEADGFTYAIEKSRLLQEISRRKNQTDGVASSIEVVMVDWELTKLLIKQTHNVYSTIKDKHPYDRGTFQERSHKGVIQDSHSFAFSPI